MPVSDIFKHRLFLRKLGITRQATVFAGFCGKHDKTVFSLIEDYPFTKTDEQIFLYAYKAFAFTFYKIQREVKLIEFLFNEYDFSNQIHYLYHREQLHLLKNLSDMN